MKKQLLLTATALLLGTTSTLGAQCCDPCGGQWGFGAQALIWQPLGCQLDYARTTRTLPQFEGPNGGEVFTVKSDYNWGFKVWGQYGGECLFASLGYTWFEDSTGDNVSTADPALSTSYGVTMGTGETFFQGLFGTFAEASVRFEYQNVDLRVGSEICSSCCGDIYLFGNLRWVDVKRTSHQRLEAPDQLRATRFRQTSEFDGAGLGFGVGGDANICGGLRFFGEANVMGIIGSRKTPEWGVVSDSDGAIATFFENYPSETCVVPELDAKIGLSYTHSCHCWTFVIEIGYEVDYFWNSLILRNELIGIPNNNNFMPVFALSELNFERRCADAGFAGPFFGGRILF